MPDRQLEPGLDVLHHGARLETVEVLAEHVHDPHLTRLGGFAQRRHHPIGVVLHAQLPGGPETEHTGRHPIEHLDHCERFPDRITPHTAPNDSTAPTEKNDPIESAEAADPTENTEAADPSDPTDSTEPTEPIDSAEPLLAIDSTESSDQSDNFELCRWSDFIASDAR